MSSSRLETANLDWRNENTPVSSQYDDIYYSSTDGYAESEYVFLQNNFIEERFSGLNNNHFTIAETGFGTGLNFLQTWQHWIEHSKTGNKLFYISVENTPLSLNDLKKCHQNWPQFSCSLLDKLPGLYEQYPPPIRGTYHLELSHNVTLVLLLDDAQDGFQTLIKTQQESLPGFEAVDAWYLDGFAPSRNPEMWTQSLFNTMGQLSNSKTTFSSFTAAGIVRNGLKSAGFIVDKIKGFGKKRDMIRGTYSG